METARPTAVLPAIPKPRIFKPKTDKDCPCCQAQVAGGQNPETVCDQHVIIRSMRKQPGGKKKSIRTAGYFSSNPCCYYDDPTIHALVGFGARGKYETIQNLRCQFFHKKFTVRRYTVMYRMKTLSTTVAKVLHLAGSWRNSRSKTITALFRQSGTQPCTTR